MYQRLLIPHAWARFAPLNQLMRLQLLALVCAPPAPSTHRDNYRCRVLLCGPYDQGSMTSVPLTKLYVCLPMGVVDPPWSIHEHEHICVASTTLYCGSVGPGVSSHRNGRTQVCWYSSLLVIWHDLPVLRYGVETELSLPNHISKLNCTWSLLVRRYWLFSD